MFLKPSPSRLAMLAVSLLALAACSDDGSAGGPDISQQDAGDTLDLDGTSSDATDLETSADGSDDTLSPLDLSGDAGPEPTDLGSVPEPDLVIVPGEDSDGDGISDVDEVDIVGTDPFDPDTDGDGLIDGAELDFGSNPLLADSDNDGLTDDQEFLAQTRPDMGDSDGDGFMDGEEIAQGSDPLNPFSWDYEGGVWPNAISRADGHYGNGYAMGDLLPNPAVRDQNDDAFELWRLYGNVVLLDFSAGWCQPCKELAEGAQDMWETYREQGFMIVHLVTETTLPGEPADLAMQQAWANEFGLEFPVVRDDTGYLYDHLSTQDYYPGSIPFMILLDRDMRIAASFAAGQEPQLQSAIEGLLSGAPGLFPHGAPEASEPLEDSTTTICDQDGDGYESFACGGDDCHDHTPLAGPGADEVCDLMDWNCDGDVDWEATDTTTLYLDADGDGYGNHLAPLEVCVDAYWPLVSNGADCNDDDDAIHPDTVWYLDADEDGYGDPNTTLTQCTQPESYVSNGQDTDDDDATSLGCWGRVSVGRDHSCGLKLDGSIDCWGDNSTGELLYPAGNDFVAIDSGYQHTCAQKSDGTLVCWGSTAYGASTAPPGVVFQSFTCGLNACCGITDQANDNLLCWGQNDDGQTDTPQGTFSAVSIAGGRHACAVQDSGQVQCWGKSAGFQGGASPTAVVPGSYAQISAAHYFTCALSQGGTPTCWGGDQYGQGSPPAGTYLSVLGATVHSCGIKSDHTLACWGSDSYDRTNCPEGQFAQVDVNQLHSCAVGSDGLIACWGYGEEGQTSVPACNP